MTATILGMRTSFTVALALIAGFLGGLASRSWSPAPVYAQAPAAPPAELRAQKFVLVDENGVARGVFGLEANGSPAVEVADAKGRVYTTRWYVTRTKDFFHDLPMIHGKTTLLP